MYVTKLRMREVVQKRLNAMPNNRLRVGLQQSYDMSLIGWKTDQQKMDSRTGQVWRSTRSESEFWCYRLMPKIPWVDKISARKDGGVKAMPVKNVTAKTKHLDMGQLLSRDSLQMCIRDRTWTMYIFLDYLL